MKRSYIQRKPKRRRAVAMRAMAKNKALGKSAVDKGPARDVAHLAKVRAEPCLNANRACAPNIEAHHCRHIRPRTMGKRVSDHLTVPLCAWHHRYLHSMNEALFWIASNIDPAEWIAQFSAEGAAELARRTQAPDTRGKANLQITPPPRPA